MRIMLTSLTTARCLEEKWPQNRVAVRASRRSMTWACHGSQSRGWHKLARGGIKAGREAGRGAVSQQAVGQAVGQ